VNEEVSYEMVECLGACEMAPMLRVDQHYVGSVNLEKLDALLEKE